jgi:hypothetical protein
MASLIPLKACIHQAIDALEGFANAVDFRRCGTALRNLSPESAAQARAELLDILDGTRRVEFEVLAQLVWRVAVEDRRWTLWCVRQNSPAVALVYLICRRAEIPFSALLTGHLIEDDLWRMMEVAPKLAGAPLRLCAASSPAGFAGALEATRLDHPGAGAVCDWPLSHAERGVARRSGLRVIAPAGAVPKVIVSASCRRRIGPDRSPPDSSARRA